MKYSVLKSIVLFSSSIILLSNCEEPGSGFKNTSMKTFGGKSNDIGYSVLQTTDGGYIITGVTASYGGGGGDLWLVKADASGNTVWTKAIGGAEYDAGYLIEQTTDGGYIIVGATESYGAGDEDIWLIKVDATGEIVWTRTYGGSSWDSGRSVQQTSDGGYIVVGATESYGAGDEDIWLIKIKTDASGDTVWTRTFGGTGDDFSSSVLQTSDGDYIIAGATASYGAGNIDIWLIKTNASGDTLWTKTFGSTANDLSYSFRQTSDGGYIIVGATESYGAGGSDVWLIKTDKSGEIDWTNTVGGVGYDFGYSVQQTTDGGYIVAGSTQSYAVGGLDVWLVKIDESGNLDRGAVYGGAGEEEGMFVQQTSDGGYIITGYTNSYGAGNYDVFLIKTDEEGKPVFSI